MTRSSVATPLPLSLALLAVACVTPAAIAASRPLSLTAPAAAATSTAADDTILALTNRERERAGLAPLRANALLAHAARIQAEQLARADKLAHDLPGMPYPRLRDRLTAAGYLWSLAGENIAWNYSAAGTVAMWMHSPPHRHNLLDAGFTEIGVAAMRARDGHSYYVQVFGRPRKT